MNSTPIETERKFLIYMPCLETLCSQPEIRIQEINQTYLLTDGKKNARIRKITERGKISYIKTVKERISDLSCYEEEKEITEDCYLELLKYADEEKQSINKTRYSFKYGRHVIEIDIYSFWNDRATLEIELSSEDEEFSIPEFIKVAKEVSTDKRYKNTNLAKSVPQDKI